jgi:hypothetical protein
MPLIKQGYAFSLEKIRHAVALKSVFLVIELRPQLEPSPRGAVRQPRLEKGGRRFASCMQH